jgi:hypothetical protein
MGFVTVSSTNLELPSAQEVFEEGLRYFMGHGEINQALEQLASDLDRLGIEYQVVGAVALLAHGYPRFTVDIDLVVTPTGLERFRNELVGLGYVPAFPGAKKGFRSTTKNVKIDLITSGEYPGDGRPKPVVFPVPSEGSVVINGIRYATLEKLIELKLASGMTSSDRIKDLGDVQELIKFRGLDAEFAVRLDPYVRDKYLSLYEGIENARSTESE